MESSIWASLGQPDSLTAMPIMSPSSYVRSLSNATTQVGDSTSSLMSAPHHYVDDHVMLELAAGSMGDYTNLAAMGPSSHSGWAEDLFQGHHGGYEEDDLSQQFSPSGTTRRNSDQGLMSSSIQISGTKPKSKTKKKQKDKASQRTVAGTDRTPSSGITAILKTDYLDYLTSDLPRWVMLSHQTAISASSHQTTSYPLSTSSTTTTRENHSPYYSLQQAYTTVCQLDARMEGDAIQSRMALVRLHLEYLAAYETWQRSTTSSTNDHRGGQESGEKSEKRRRRHHTSSTPGSSSITSGSGKGSGSGSGNGSGSSRSRSNTAASSPASSTGQGRGDATCIIDNILEQLYHDGWTSWSDNKRSAMRAKFHDRKRYGKRWVILAEGLGKAILLVCSSQVASMV